MFMSIFSSLDALCAESIGQQKLGRSFKVGSSSSADCSNSRSGAAAAAASSTAHKDDHNTTTPPPPPTPVVKRMNSDNRRRVQPEKRLRFAVELDGLHCFETIVPY